MAKDDDTGITPKAKDGVPDPDQADADNELARRAALKAEREAAEEAQVTGNGKRRRGQPIDTQAGDDDGDDEPTAAEMFPQGAVAGDHKVTMKNIVPAGKARKTEAAMSRAAVPLLDGLVRYGDHVELLVTAEAGAVNEVPDLEDQESSDRRVLRGVKDVQTFRVVHVRSADAMYTLDQVLDILEQKFAIPRTATKVREVFGLDQPQAATG